MHNLVRVPPPQEAEQEPQSDHPPLTGVGVGLGLGDGEGERLGEGDGEGRGEGLLGPA